MIDPQIGHFAIQNPHYSIWKCSFYSMYKTFAYLAQTPVQFLGFFFQLHTNCVMSTTDLEQIVNNTLDRVDRIEECLTVINKDGLPSLVGWNEETNPVDLRINSLKQKLKKRKIIMKSQSWRMTNIEADHKMLRDEAVHQGLDDDTKWSAIDSRLIKLETQLKTFENVTTRLNAIERFLGGWRQKPSPTQGLSNPTKTAIAKKSSVAKKPTPAKKSSTMQSHTSDVKTSN